MLATLSIALVAAQAQTAHDTSAKAFVDSGVGVSRAGVGDCAGGDGDGHRGGATLPTSKVTFTVGRTRDRYDVADWNPETHPTPPAFVMHGRKPVVMACGFCHLADGRGRPENAMIAGLPADYLMQQVKDMRTRARHSASPVPYAPGIAMQQIADSVTDAELEVAAQYFTKVRARRASKVVEADSVPKTMPLNGLSTLLPGTEREALAGRLIELPLELRRHELHDPMAEYVAYVPRGSLARGRALAAGDPTHGVKGCDELSRSVAARRRAGAAAGGAVAVVHPAAARRVPHGGARDAGECADEGGRVEVVDRGYGGGRCVCGVEAALNCNDE